MRPAAEILLVEAAALRPILERTPPAGFDVPTVCVGWSVRDVLAHCAAALTRTARGAVHAFTPEDNQADVDQRRGNTVAAVLEELFEGYAAAATAIDAAGGKLDGVGIGEWMHGGDVREALGERDAYAGAGSDMALDLLFERSRRMNVRAIDVHLDGAPLRFGSAHGTAALAHSDPETFVRLTGGRRPDPARYRLRNCTAEDFILFS